MPKRTPPGSASSDPPSAFRGIAETRISVSFAGRKRSVDTEEGLETRILSDALAGKISAAREVLGWIEEREAKGPASTAPLIKFLTDNSNPAPLDDAALLLGIASVDPARRCEDGSRFLQIEPWAVQASLARRKRWEFNARALEDLKLQVRDPESVSWPGDPDDE